MEEGEEGFFIFLVVVSVILVAIDLILFLVFFSILNINYKVVVWILVIWIFKNLSIFFSGFSF